jgi:hypothetical protein
VDRSKYAGSDCLLSDRTNFTVVLHKLGAIIFLCPSRKAKYKDTNVHIVSCCVGCISWSLRPKGKDLRCVWKQLGQSCSDLERMKYMSNSEHYETRCVIYTAHLMVLEQWYLGGFNGCHLAGLEEADNVYRNLAWGTPLSKRVQEPRRSGRIILR